MPDLTPDLTPGAQAGASARRLRVCALYPDLMNIYADRGNLLMLERRCAWRGIDFELSSSSLGEPLDASAHDLFYLGGGQDRDQRLCAEDLLETKRDALHEAASRGAIVLGICGGYQLLGRSYVLGERADRGRRAARRRDRARGRRAADRQRRDRGASRWRRPSAASGEGAGDGGARVLAGFENHGGRTTLAPGQAPLGRVLRGHGNDGRSGFEGARSGNTIGTYLHGPLLPKNSWFADWLIARAIGLDERELEPLEDTLELAAHAGARHVAGLSA